MCDQSVGQSSEAIAALYVGTGTIYVSDPHKLSWVDPPPSPISACGGYMVIFCSTFRGSTIQSISAWSPQIQQGFGLWT